MRHDLGWLQCTSGEHGPIIALQQWPRARRGGQKPVFHIEQESKPGALLARVQDMAELDVNPAADASLTAAPAPVLRPEHTEGDLARLIEQQTARIPSHWFLLGAMSSMGLSLALELARRPRASRFVGQWPAPLLIMGLYNKLVKTLGTR